MYRPTTMLNDTYTILGGNETPFWSSYSYPNDPYKSAASTFPYNSPYRLVSSCSFDVRSRGRRSRCNNNSSRNTLQQRQQLLIPNVLVPFPTGCIRLLSMCGSAAFGSFRFSLATARQSLPSQLLPLYCYFVIFVSGVRVIRSHHMTRGTLLKARRLLAACCSARRTFQTLSLIHI